MSEEIRKETAAQASERIKREKNPWQAFDEVREFAQKGWSAVTPEWSSTYFKWWGIYPQGDGAGATGHGKATEFFMMRIGIPNGILTAKQLRTIGELAQKHARNLTDITVRQAIQLHWLPIESLPEVVDAITAAGLSPKGACGDVVRNVTGCPLAGVDAAEAFDASPVALATSKLLSGNEEFYNLPRKFKIGITGCKSWCNHPEINDAGLTPAKKDGRDGFSLRVGGGLSREPHVAVKLDAFILPEQVPQVVHGMVEIFKEQEGLRENRLKARMKYLFMKEDWTAEKFLSVLQSKLPFELETAGVEEVPEEILRDHTGVHPQQQEGLYYVGASVLRGRLSGEQLVAAANLAEKYGDGSLRTTVAQNLIFVNIPKENTAKLTEELAELGLRVEGSPFWRGAVSCTGTEFCRLAITETKGFTRWLVDEMENRLPEFDEQLKLHVTGCPNGCGQHWVADIGIEGKKIKQDGQMLDAYYFCLGGALGKDAGIARPVGYRCLATDVPESIERLLRQYLGNRSQGETLRRWFQRHSNDELRTALAGGAAEVAERDKPTGRPPAE